MANETAKEQLAALMDSYQGGLKAIQDTQRRRQQLSATASDAKGLVTATVDADGILTGIEFTSRLDSTHKNDLATAVVQATRDAAAHVRQKTAELMASIQDEDPSLPTMSDFLPGAPDLMALIPEAATLTPVPIKNPHSEEDQREYPDAAALPPTPAAIVFDRGWEGDDSVESPPTESDLHDEHREISEVADRGW